MAQISLRIDDEVKREAEQVLNEIGLSMSAAINIFLKKVSREKRIPFELSIDPFYSENNIQYLKEIMQEIKNGISQFSQHELIEID